MDLSKLKYHREQLEKHLSGYDRDLEKSKHEKPKRYIEILLGHISEAKHNIDAMEKLLDEAYKEPEKIDYSKFVKSAMRSIKGRF